MLPVESVREVLFFWVDLVYNEVCVCLLSSCKDSHFVVVGEMIQTLLHIGPYSNSELNIVGQRDLKVFHYLLVGIGNDLLTVDQSFIQIEDQGLVS